MVKKDWRTAAVLLLFVLLASLLLKNSPAAVRSAQNRLLRSVTGTVANVSVESLTLRMADGQEMTFRVTGAQRSGLPGTFEGDLFTIRYEETPFSGGLIPNAYTYEKIAGRRWEDKVSLPDTLPESWRDGGIFQDTYDAAYETLKTLTTKQKVGQLFLARFPNEDTSVGTVNRYQPGGFVLFSRDFEGRSPKRIREILSAVQNASLLPLLIATDEEGGDVVRISQYSQLADAPFPSPQALLAKGGVNAVEKDAKKKARLLKNLGINLNLAPVADVSNNPADYIYPRTAGRPPKETGDYVAAAVKGTQETGVSASLKHFPGYGNNPDTHTGPARDERPFSTFDAEDFLPFRSGIASGAHSVLVSHTIVTCMDSKNPASLSPGVHKILREHLGFTGVVITDDLLMEAVAGRKSTQHPAVEAVLAGNDLILISDLESGYNAVLQAVEQGIVPAAQLDRAVFRILAWKHAKGLFG